ncbi:MAG TPA: hypothetical protein VJI13_03605 [Candidatus Norongarragalinales archaeon]|nr:hypothetical protein [Candidatus Norongarragalinales archaeon]
MKKISEAFSPLTGVVIRGLAVLLFFSVIRASFFGEVSEEKRIWFDLSFLLLLAVLAELLVAYQRQPSVMILLLLGAAISPSAIAIIYPALTWLLVLLLNAAQLGIALPATVPHLISGEGTILSGTEYAIIASMAFITTVVVPWMLGRAVSQMDKKGRSLSHSGR